MSKLFSRLLLVCPSTSLGHVQSEFDNGLHKAGKQKITRHFTHALLSPDRQERYPEVDVFEPFTGYAARGGIRPILPRHLIGKSVKELAWAASERFC